ncbi:uncharacterized protein LOC144908532 isoform X3 [Branchiostoma floridae x Branchiostoma belcheri]
MRAVTSHQPYECCPVCGTQDDVTARTLQVSQTCPAEGSIGAPRVCSVSAVSALTRREPARRMTGPAAFTTASTSRSRATGDNSPTGPPPPTMTSSPRHLVGGSQLRPASLIGWTPPPLRSLIGQPSSATGSAAGGDLTASTRKKSLDTNPLVCK